VDYISMGYFAQVRGQGTVGSSTMPHKVNPIRFENAEANLEVSAPRCWTCSARRSSPVADAARPDRLVDAAQYRHGLRALAARDRQCRRGLAGLDAVPAVMAADLDANWEVLAEPIQSAMRALARQGVPGMDNPYERLKELTRGRRIGADDLRAFIDGLGLPEDVRLRLQAMTPHNYVGIAPALVDHLG
jgi:adenylosuccinate lyase